MPRVQQHGLYHQGLLLACKVLSARGGVLHGAMSATNTLMVKRSLLQGSFVHCVTFPLLQGL